MRKPTLSTQILVVLKDIHSLDPTVPLCNHIDISMSEYTDIWGVSDKDFLDALLKYKSELELDPTPNKNIDTIIEEGKNLETLFSKEEGEDWDSY